MVTKMAAKIGWKLESDHSGTNRKVTILEQIGDFDREINIKHKQKTKIF